MNTVTHFDSLLPAGKIWFSTKEVAALLGRSTQFVRDCCETGRLHGHRFARSQATDAARYSYQFHRDALQLFLLETATYAPDDFIERLASLLKGRSVDEAKAIFRRAGVLLAIGAPEQSEPPKRATPPPRLQKFLATGTC